MVANAIKVVSHILVAPISKVFVTYFECHTESYDM